MTKLLKIPNGKRSRVYKPQIGWKLVGKKRIYFRSQWEWKYAIYLQFLKETDQIAEWEYEPQIFIFEKIIRGTRSYKPDFRVIHRTGEHYWVEVKGYMDSKSLTKIKRFRKYFPKETLVVIDQIWFLKNSCLLHSMSRI